MSDARPFAVLLSPVLPLPGGSGRALRAWDWLQTLAREHRVLVVTPAPAYQTLPAEYPAQALWSLAPAVAPGRRWQRRAGLLCPWLTLCSARFALDWLHPTPRLAGLLADRSAELEGAPVRRIVVFRLYLQPLALALARQFPAASLELDLDDWESRTRRSVAGTLRRLGRRREALRELAGALQYGLVERAASGAYRTLYLAAQDDCARLATRLAGAVKWRPNRVCVPQGLALAPHTRELRLLFVGALDYPPNEEAVRALLELVLPRLRFLPRPWRLCVVGRGAPAALRARLRREPRVDHVADADDVAPLYAAAHVALVPLRAGGGTKLKALEAFAHRRPLIATRHGVRGLGAQDERDCLLAETAAQFARAIERLAQDRALADRLADAGRALCEREYRAGSA